MEINEDIVIVGAGIAGLATALGLHRLGLRSLVLESSDGLRITGFALITWNNAWKALEALGIADSIRRRHLPLDGFGVSSAVTGLPISEKSLRGRGR
ncbi:monooxygenase 2-like [Malania oleifera]|uniref:monooxygenase 2-like n=1 Tax=Malania oleifera TaxID=397392 RepID=UPI0025ADF5E8|nr:monooxygenase 2-like [Malania oleifera]